MTDYGVYLHGGQYPLHTGTRKQCKEYVNVGLTPQQRIRGWTIAPIAPEPYWPAASSNQSHKGLWATVGAAFCIFALSLFVLCLKACARLH